jgi:hypothetical protein
MDAEAASREHETFFHTLFCALQFQRRPRQQVSLDFYTRVLGFTLLDKYDFPDMKFSLVRMSWLGFAIMGRRVIGGHMKEQ